ncbi:MAG TPA: Rho termination factor N-terminal domain-containing protein, partial [Acidimicrobiales bacterium]|nr:Rho termination factor N-terminal domain-containing protein [Acidimicrobiales bacterium]
KGPSDERAADPEAREESGGTATGGVDVKGNTKEELMDRARELDVSGRSRMNKQELAEAIKKANDRETAKARNS